ncbi:CBS domain-containing protein [Poseidonibacter lekithochrous]|uniref:CBS domain-containing protein n=1 Tax=Poseidonibacter lekithochrous TaxID=1904463 RepID=UPI000D386794|nr:CBS domain-containing protein [Poseidonibacter lekithochrous]
MFAIYNNGSVAIRSSADNLYQIKNTDAPSDVSLKPDDDTLFQELSKKQENNQNKANQEQLNAYKQMANIDTTEAVYHVKDIMTADCIFLLENATVMDSYNTLKDAQVSQVPILSNDKKILGLINKKIILNLILEDLENSREILSKKVGDLYLPQLITTDPITDIRRVSKVMIDFKLDAIPVVDEEDTLVGIVSKSDIIKAVSTIPKLQLYS